jgi:MYXO-CTERM domain-containing protein
MIDGTALIPLVLAWTSPTLPIAPSEAIRSRPYGAVMGDGLRDEIAIGVQAGGVCAPGETVFGIDVSYYQDVIDWNAVAADGVSYAIIRVSHSLQFFDPQFEANLAGARAAGIHAGVYQYFEPGEDPVAQADLLLDSLGPLQPGDLPPMIDVESTGGQSPAAINTAIHAWIDRVESTLGVKPVIYSGYYFWNDNVGSSDFGEYPLMLPWYGVDCPGGVNVGWDTWTIHQYCDCGSVAGISGAVDVDRFNGSLADLEGLTFAPVCGDGSCTGAETPYTCAGDCPPCGVIEATGATLDNGDACYQLHGDADYWHEEPQGEGGSLVWTNVTDFDMAYNFAVWQLNFVEAGRYEVEVHITQPFGMSKQATYQIHHADGDTPVAVDQSTSTGWVSLGEYAFAANADQSVRLDDNTGEPESAALQLVFDALRVTRLDLDPADTGASGESEGEEDGTAGPSEGTSGVAESDGEPQPMDESTGIGGTAAQDDDAGGCGCRSATGDGLGWLVGLGALALSRRRRLTRPLARRISRGLVPRSAARARG